MTAPVPLATAVVGCGVIGRTHVDAILGLDRLRLSALVDPVAERADALAATVEERTGVRPAAHSSIGDALAGPGRPDLLVLATPSGMHVDQAIEGLEGGAHVLVEKPLDVDVRRARRLAAVARVAAGRGQVCSIVSQHRFDPSSQAVRRAIAGGELGRLTSAVASVSWWRSQAYYDSGDWRGTWALDGGGALMNQGVHTLDLLLWFLGRPVTVSAEFGLLAHEGVEVEDTVVATLVFESGALAVLHATTAAYPGLTARVQVLGERGSAVIDADRLEYFHAAGDDGDGASPAMGRRGGGNQAERHRDPAEPALAGIAAAPVTRGHLRQYLDLLAAVDGAGAPGVTVDDALLALATVRAVYVSATTGEKVAVADVLGGRFDDVAPAVTRPVTV
ncbi:Gfo/Idh/MocA family protein [Pseudonocardia kunmingensis]|uniref:Putative dehydrogenase n=1 Tax=Pseudonocardia kunmingensis TaxID=630975 RepID=A0A543D0K5_9PSEU|nr:Gfo/Idh/MocA family oxidoreductase [Pseudonocardia kunmingensis]TQM02852.1 putative dehydrogenase [Pseudonocardia kunmingensis]